MLSEEDIEILGYLRGIAEGIYRELGLEDDEYNEGDFPCSPTVCEPLKVLPTKVYKDDSLTSPTTLSSLDPLPQLTPQQEKWLCDLSGITYNSYLEKVRKGWCKSDALLRSSEFFTIKDVMRDTGLYPRDIEELIEVGTFPEPNKNGEWDFYEYKTILERFS